MEHPENDYPEWRLGPPKFVSDDSPPPSLAKEIKAVGEMVGEFMKVAKVRSHEAAIEGPGEFDSHAVENNDRVRMRFSAFHGLVVTASRDYIDVGPREVCAYINEPQELADWLASHGYVGRSEYDDDAERPGGDDA